MRISAKGRYALAAVISMAERYRSGDLVSLLSIAERFGLSKIYLEQVFALLKRSGIVMSTKGSQGGYQLARDPRQITARDVLAAVDTTLFERAEDTVQDRAPAIEAAMRALVLDPLEQAMDETLSQVNLSDLCQAVERYRPEKDMMFYI